MRILLTVLVLLVALGAGFGGGFGAGRLTAPEPPPEPVFEDPWDREKPEPQLLQVEKVTPPDGFRYPVTGNIDGYVTFGIISPQGPLAVKVDGTGQVVWAYRFSGELPRPFPIPMDVQELDNGNILLIIMWNGVYEISPAGDIVWSYLDPWVSHHAQRLDNGNTVVVEAERSLAFEVNQAGEKVWEWDAREEILPLTAETFLGFAPPLSTVIDPMTSMYAEYREKGELFGLDWTHINAAYRTEQGTTLIDIRNMDLVVEVDSDNNVVWTYGPLVLKHQHAPIRLANGNTLIYDNGNGRVVEVSPDGEIVWQWQGFVSPVMGNAQRLPNGLTLILEATGGVFNAEDSVPRIFAVNAAGDIVWELEVPASEDNPFYTTPDFRGVYRAWWVAS